MQGQKDPHLTFGVRTKMIRLSDVDVGSVYMIVSYQHFGRRLRKRICDLGLTPNCPINIIINSRSGPVLVEIRGTRIAIGRGTARKIEVAEIEGV